MIDINKVSEGLDYTIEPFKHADDNGQAWVAAVKTGLYKNHVLMFTHVEYNGKRKNIRFQLSVFDSSDNTVEISEHLTDYAFEVLQDIIRNGLANGGIVLDDKDSDH